MASTIRDNWYEDFFQGLNCEIWEKAISDDWTKQEVDFLVSELDLQPGESVLDIPCGFGRHTLSLTKRGYKVTGLDISATFVNNLKQKAAAEKLDINIIHSDLLKTDFSQHFDGAICMGNSFGYFDFEKMKIFVQKVSESLNLGGSFIINSGVVAESILPNFPKVKSFTFGNIKMDISNSYSVENGYMISDITYNKDGIQENYSYKHYVFTLNEIKRLLHEFGLRTKAFYNSPTKSGFNFGDPQVYIVAQKTGII